MPHLSYHTLWTLLEKNDEENEWIQLEKEIINFINSESDDHQRVENVSSHDGGDQVSHVDQESSIIYFSKLECALRRRWTSDDTMRIFRRLIENQGGDRTILDITDEEYEDKLHSAINEDLEFLRTTYGDLEANYWTEDNRGTLFLDSLLEIENLLCRWEMNPDLLEQESENSTMERGDGLSEKTISKYLKTRGCNYEGVEVCVVCQDQLYQEKGMIATLACGHEYHVDCIKTWLRKKNICPLCNAKALSWKITSYTHSQKKKSLSRRNMSRWTPATVFRWIDVSFSMPTSFFRWPRLFASYLTPPSWTSSFSYSFRILEPWRWAPHLRLPDVDDVVWSVVSAVESVALVSFLCFFFVFCGCTL